MLVAMNVVHIFTCLSPGREERVVNAHAHISLLANCDCFNGTLEQSCIVIMHLPPASSHNYCRVTCRPPSPSANVLSETIIAVGETFICVHIA